MKFVVNRADILKASNHIQRVVERKSTLPILSNVKMTVTGNKLSLQATDMEIELTEVIEVQGIKNGTTTTPAHTLSEIIKKLPENSEVEISEVDDSLELKAGRSKFRLHTSSSDMFPEITNGEYDTTLTLNVNELTYLLTKVSFAMSTEETRYYLNGIYLHIKNKENEGLVLRSVATDGHRLAKAELASLNIKEEINGVIIPRKTVLEIEKLASDLEGDVEISISESKIKFSLKDIILTSKVIDGTFPDYERVIPSSNDKFLEVEKKEFFSSVDRVATISFEKTRAIKLQLYASTLKLTSHSQESGNAEEELEASWKFDEFEIGFNSKYLLEVIGQIQSKSLKFSFSSSGSPVVINDLNDDGLLYVLMPMRI